MKTMISEGYFTEEQIFPVLTQLQETLTNVERGPAIVALLSMCIILQNPELTPEQLQDAVRDTSRYICLLLDNDSIIDESGDSKRRMN